MELVSVSNVSPYKRQGLVIQALPALIARPGLESLVYRVVGHRDERYHAELLDLAKRLNVSDRVRFEGRIPDEAVRDRLRSARCFVLMSVCESFGIPAIEAMSFGTPVVTSDCCAMPEVCGDGADLCPADDVAALTERLARVLTDAAHAEDLRRRGAARVAAFGWSATGARLASILDDLTAAAAPQPNAPA
jgi:glycosyltransferase involved in cell wall biosynthesis